MRRDPPAGQEKIGPRHRHEDSIMTARRLALFGICGAVLAAGCASPRMKTGKTAEGEVVIAEGSAPYRADDLPGSRAAALAAAQRSAVELVVGVYVSGRTQVQKAVAIQNNILTKTDGYIKRYEVI